MVKYPINTQGAKGIESFLVIFFEISIINPTIAETIKLINSVENVHVNPVVIPITANNFTSPNPILCLEIIQAKSNRPKPNAKPIKSLFKIGIKSSFLVKNSIIYKTTLTISPIRIIELGIIFNLKSVIDTISKIAKITVNLTIFINISVFLQTESKIKKLIMLNTIPTITVNLNDIGLKLLKASVSFLLLRHIIFLYLKNTKSIITIIKEIKTNKRYLI